MTAATATVNVDDDDRQLDFKKLNIHSLHGTFIFRSIVHSVSYAVSALQGGSKSQKRKEVLTKKFSSEESTRKK